MKDKDVLIVEIAIKHTSTIPEHYLYKTDVKMVVPPLKIILSTIQTIISKEFRRSITKFICLVRK